MNKIVDLLQKRIEHLEEQKDYWKEDLEKLKRQREKNLEEIADIEQEIKETKEAVDILVNKSW